MMQNIIENGMIRFINHQILQFKDARQVPIHFVGSIAFLLKDEIELVLKTFELKLGRVVKRPIDGLVAYHKSLLDVDFL